MRTVCVSQVLGLCLLVAASAAGGEVLLDRAIDGTYVLHNHGGDAGSPATAARLRDRAPTPSLDRMIDRQAGRHRLDPDLVRAVVAVESGYRTAAVSRKGAVGLMQLMPTTSKALAVSDPLDPEQNLAGGAAYLRRMLDLFGGDLRLALAGYNAGPEAVRRHGGIPPFPETRAYVRRVLSLYGGDVGGEGRAVYLQRDASGQLVLTTTPPTDR